MTLGDVAAWPLESVWCPATNGKPEEVQRGAREEAKRLQGLVDRRIDPRQDKADQLAATEARRTEQQRHDAFAREAWGSYMEQRKPKWGERTYRDHENASTLGGKPVTRGRRAGQGTTTQPGLLCPLLAQPLSTLTADVVRVWLRQEAAKRPTQARGAFAMLRAFLNWCSDQPAYLGQVDVDACRARTARDELPRITPKVDCLQREQLKPWFEKVRKLGPTHAAYLQALLLTGARRGELTGLRWVDVDFQWKSLTIHDKMEGERTIPLTPFVASLMHELKTRNETPPSKPRKLRTGSEPPAPWRPSLWVFGSSTAKSGRLVEPRIAHNKAVAAAGLPGLTLHGLRRSFGTLAEWVECPVGISAQIMGHKPSALAEKHYRQRPIDLLRMWHTKIEAWILNEAGIEQPPAEGTPRLESVPGKAA
jgi:integrase